MDAGRLFFLCCPARSDLQSDRIEYAELRDARSESGMMG